MKLFVFDFHGVLEKGNEGAVLEVSNHVLNRFGYSERFSEADCGVLYGKKWYEYFAYMLPYEPHQRHLELQEACFNYSDSHPEIIARHIQPNDHAHEVLEAIAQHHYQILISNTKPASLKIFLEAVNMTPYFSSENAFAVDTHEECSIRTKHDVLKEFLRGKDFDRIVIVGDSPEEISLVSVAGGTSYLYSHPGRPFRDCESDYRINDLRELLKEI